MVHPLRGELYPDLVTGLFPRGHCPEWCLRYSAAFPLSLTLAHHFRMRRVSAIWMPNRKEAALDVFIAIHSPSVAPELHHRPEVRPPHPLHRHQVPRILPQPNRRLTIPVGRIRQSREVEVGKVHIYQNGGKVIIRNARSPPRPPVCPHGRPRKEIPSFTLRSVLLGHAVGCASRSVCPASQRRWLSAAVSCAACAWFPQAHRMHEPVQTAQRVACRARRPCL